MDLSTFNTLKLTSQAKYTVRCDHMSVLTHLFEQAKWRDKEWYILGGGSNVVLPEQLEGVVIHVALHGKSLLFEDDEAYYVSAQAGENWHAFVLWTLAQGYAGLENLALIPGTVGAAPVQNIGAYGVEIKDYLQYVVAYELTTGQLQRFTAQECAFAYRDSVFKQQYVGRFLITEVVFRLPKIPVLHIGYGEIAVELDHLHLTPNPQHIAQAVMNVRRRKLPDPLQIGNAGSFFKNPLVSYKEAERLLQQFPTLPTYPARDSVKLAAGWLIEKAGWKGRRIGPVGMYEKQALVLVNYGGATAKDVKILCTAVQNAVYRQCDIMLETEPVFW